jgi:hypothetical protein
MRLNWNPPKVARQRVIYAWSAAHAVHAHEGAIFDNGTVMPPRRWTDFAIANTPIQQIMREQFVITGSIDLAFREMATILNQQFRAAIESPIWDWPRVTQRQSGEIATSPRNTVDLGTLRDSQSMRWEVTGLG